MDDIASAWRLRLWLALLALVLVQGGGVSLAAGAKSSPKGHEAPVEETVMFGTLLADALQPGYSIPAAASDAVRARLESFRERALAFRSRLPSGAAKPGPEKWAHDKKMQFERGIVALATGAGIENLARDLAHEAPLAYEWEGMSDGPRAEAGFAALVLDKDPATPAAAYLKLFLLHRLRCVCETLVREGRTREADMATASYEARLDAARRDADPLVRFAAEDLNRRAYLYLKTDHPSSSGPAEGTATAEPFECPDSAAPAAVADPRAWARRCFAISEGDDAGRADSLTEFAADFDRDGTPELFIGSKVARGNAGGTHYVFRKRGAAYAYLGSLFLHPAAFKVLAPCEGGLPCVARYRRLGADEGLLEILVYKASTFQLKKSEKVRPQGEDGALLRAMFGGDFDGALSPVAPSLALERALDLAMNHVAETKIDLSRQYIQSVVLRYDDRTERRGPYWHIQWMWNQPALGGEYGLRVYMDGTIVEARLGP